MACQTMRCNQEAEEFTGVAPRARLSFPHTGSALALRRRPAVSSGRRRDNSYRSVFTNDFGGVRTYEPIEKKIKHFGAFSLNWPACAELRSEPWGRPTISGSNCDRVDRAPRQKSRS